MSATVRYVWRFEPREREDPMRLAGLATAVLSERVRRWPGIYLEGKVEGYLFGILDFILVIRDKDRWTCHRKARRLLARIQRLTDIPLNRVAEVELERPPVHSNRSNAWLAEHSMRPDTSTCKNGHVRPRGVKCRLCATKPRRKVATPWPAQRSV